MQPQCEKIWLRDKDMGQQSNKLSIIIPVYNEPDSLKIMVQILETTLDFLHEVLVVYDSPQDSSKEAANWLKAKYPNVYLVFNDFGKGAANAIKKGISVSKGNIILITLVDEVFPIVAINDMLKLINDGCDFVSCTRYALGGRRLGGSFIGGLLSRLANKTFCLITGSALTDATTGIKMLRKSVFDNITIEADVGWAFAFEISIKAQILGLKLGEVPITSIDRLFGGGSTFKIGPWSLEYLKWFFWGVKRLNRFNNKQRDIVTLDKYRGKKVNNYGFLPYLYF